MDENEEKENGVGIHIRSIWEKYLEKRNDVFIAFIDREKAYDRWTKELCGGK